MTNSPSHQDIPAGTLVVVRRGRNGQQLAITHTSCFGPGRWPFVRRWMGDRWTVKAARAHLLRVASGDDVAQLGPPGLDVPSALRALTEAGGPDRRRTLG